VFPSNALDSDKLLLRDERCKEGFWTVTTRTTGREKKIFRRAADPHDVETKFLAHCHRCLRTQSTKLTLSLRSYRILRFLDDFQRSRKHIYFVTKLVNINYNNLKNLILFYFISCLCAHLELRLYAVQIANNKIFFFLKPASIFFTYRVAHEMSYH